MSVETEVIHEATDEVVEAFARLLPQLSSKAKPLDHGAVGRLTGASTNTLLVARVEGVIVGTLTLAMSPLLSGLRAHIEDVVVDAAARGRGVRRTRPSLLNRARLLRQVENIHSGPRTSSLDHAVPTQTSMRLLRIQ
ncbi:GNAT family N-acetyltransferase [Streptomyces griseus]|uniref:GNAT family N-acetyltransferase n=1 Tax=Streptomyces griseus TaxID=1911 RepID=UPI003816F5F6